MGIQLFKDPTMDVKHIADDEADETYCGIPTGRLRPEETIDDLASFDPDSESIHEECLNVFARQNDTQR